MMQKFASYRDLTEIGRGGMATVYRATALHGNLVAIKILDRHLAADPVARLRFHHEGSRTLMHPNIVRVLEHGEHDGQLYIVMEYVAGESLDHLIARKGRLTPEEYAPILTDVARALDHAHKHGVIHRDVKPSNILIRTNGQALLGDFGVAKSLEQTAYTATRTRIGSALYMSPEQAAGVYELTPASDIYALGVTTYYALCGRHPFEGADEIAVARMHIDEPPPPPGVIAPDIPKPVSDIVLWALHKRPAFRPQSAGQFASEFRRAISAAVLPTASAQPASIKAEVAPAVRRTVYMAEPAQTRLRPRQAFLALASAAIVIALTLVALFNTLARSSEEMTPGGPRIDAGLEGNPAGGLPGFVPTSTAPTQPPAPAFEPTPLMPTPEMLILPPLPELPTPVAPWRPTSAPAATPTSAPAQATVMPAPEPPTVTPTSPFVIPPEEPTATPSPATTPMDAPTQTPTETPVVTPTDLPPSQTPTPTETPAPIETPTPTPTEPATQTPEATATP